ncbi:uncharacterized protein PV09_03010 [Verruconis gallopava]|uniref:SRP54-type proteins GTP-binding domain-containing protein n=1 Tax=Verruconis gallopava TaxID=253628 RepID=A0A0D1XSU3_9PEZI|nr:uncharacterized protein PV09_03010 [Verruconis gallopava]KIW05801.1 hypothetical protein PV09_03010 [Verruconis gallopava]
MAVVDDKSEHCVRFLLEQLQERKKKHGEGAPPFFLGLNGVQGAGKTTLVSGLKSHLSSEPYNFNLAVLSLDDFYLKRSDQESLASAHPDNPLVQHRGQPSTHDVELLNRTLQALLRREETKLPSFDKSLHAGAGDRADPITWATVNAPGERPVDVILLEGWCVGFQAMTDIALEEKWRAAKDSEERGIGTSQLGKLKLSDVQFINDALREYEGVWRMFDAIIHIDAAETVWVYDWRREAEDEMRKAKGPQNAMTDEQVKKFVDAYYPAYELYTEALRKGVVGETGKQLRLIVGKDRRVEKMVLI